MSSKTLAKPETGFQAVIVSDNFNTSGLPLGTSWALLPLAGARIIDYTIEFLLHTSVDEVIIVSIYQAQRVEEYIKERWISSGLASFRFIFMSSESCRSLGDVLRDIDSKALIKSDFLLTQAGFVSNFDLGSALTAHKTRRIKDKNAVLTLLYSECSINHPARVRDQDAFLVLDTVTNRLLHYQHFSDNLREFDLPVEALTLNDEVTTRFDLLDCNMAICSAQIPPLFSDNFDFQTRRHLIREILTNEEILAYRVYVQLVGGKFAAFIGDLNSYTFINQSILERWCFPIVPDALNGNESSLTKYSWRWPNIYMADGVKRVAKTARLERNVLIGPNCDIADNCQLINVVMGKNCTVGANTVLKDCVLWDNVVLEPGCVVEHSILCDKSHVSAKARLTGRCILGAEVSVPSGVQVGPGAVLCKEYASVDSDVATEAATFGQKLYHWRLQKKSTSGSTDLWPAFIHLDFVDTEDGGVLGRASGGSSESESDNEEACAVAGRESNKKANGSVEPAAMDDDYEVFYQEVLESLKRGYSKQIACDNLIMEINSSKHAYNVPVPELQRRVMTAILETALEQSRMKTDTAPELIKAYLSVLSDFLPLIKNYFKPKNNSASAFSTTQLNCLAAIKEFASAKQRFVSAVSQVLYFLYDKDIFEEEVLLPWCNRLEEPLKSQLHSFIQWLQEAEEESSESD